MIHMECTHVIMCRNGVPERVLEIRKRRKLYFEAGGADRWRYNGTCVGVDIWVNRTVSPYTPELVQQIADNKERDRLLWTIKICKPDAWTVAQLRAIVALIEAPEQEHKSECVRRAVTA